MNRKRFYYFIGFLLLMSLQTMAQTSGGYVKRPNKKESKVIKTQHKTTSKKIASTSCPDSNHPHWIDLGLPSGTKWCCCNEGASTPEAYGEYKKVGQVSTAPSIAQIKELINSCSYTWTMQNGVNGGRFTGPNGDNIFLPAAGRCLHGELYGVSDWGYYLSSTPGNKSKANANVLSINPDGALWSNLVSFELPVRPVQQAAAKAMLPPTVTYSSASGNQITTITVNGVSFNMVRVEGGSFMMGSPDSDSDAWNDERPQHRVMLGDYYIGETLVTQALWKTIMDDNPSNWKGENLPIVQVSWDDCQRFVKKLNDSMSNKLTGLEFCLPSEAQWEFAARGGKKSQGYKYSGSNNIRDVAWYDKNSNRMIHPVKGKKANELGLYDMSGNVWEWCLDWSINYNGSAQTPLPGTSSGLYRVLRGGSWCNDDWSGRVARRSSGRPDTRNNCYGFRLALVHLVYQYV